MTLGDDGWIDSSVMAAMVRARQTQIVVIMHQMSVPSLLLPLLLAQTC